MDYCVRLLNGEWDTNGLNLSCAFEFKDYPPWNNGLTKAYYIYIQSIIYFSLFIGFMGLSVVQFKRTNKKIDNDRKRVNLKFWMYVTFTIKSIFAGIVVALGNLMDQTSITSKGKVVAICLTVGHTCTTVGGLISIISSARNRKIQVVDFNNRTSKAKQRQYLIGGLSAALIVCLGLIIGVLAEAFSSTVSATRTLYIAHGLFGMCSNMFVGYIHLQLSRVIEQSSIDSDRKKSTISALRRSAMFTLFCYLPACIVMLIFAFSNLLWRVEFLFYAFVHGFMNMNLLGDASLFLWHFMMYRKKVSQGRNTAYTVSTINGDTIKSDSGV